ncbi:MAG: LysM peptidoglycan-binding domain-containing protein [Chloroflexi bacterium]|nr:LysM peptidoglycan-binding domain-containing protein [Chloroflexota bacterium]
MSPEGRDPPASLPRVREPASMQSPVGERTIDLTWWLATSGVVVFLILLVGAVALYTYSQLAKLNVTPTAVAVLVPTDTPAPSATPQPAPTATPGVLLADTATPAPTPTWTQPPPPTASPTLAGTPTPVVYLVQAGDTLGAIALAYGISIDDIQKANPDLQNPDRLFVGQTITIPIPTQEPPTPIPSLPPGTVLPTPLSTAAAAANLPRSILEGDLARGYPLVLAGPRVTIHYQPGSFADLSGPQTILANAEETLGYIEKTLNVSYSGALDVYLAGSLFAPPNQALRERPYPTQRRLFLLYDGSGTPAERRYMLAHEMTHVVAWHTYGVPSTVMLSEGLATYVGQAYLDQGGFIKYQDFCRAMARTNRLPAVGAIENSTQEFQDPVRNYYSYVTSSCFLGYLFDLKGASALSQLYPTSNYTGNYGVVLAQLQIDFERSMSSGAFQITFDPERLVSYYEETRDGYAQLFARPNPDLTAYDVLDDARIAVLTGNFDGARALLDQFHVLAK